MSVVLECLLKRGNVLSASVPVSAFAVVPRCINAAEIGAFGASSGAARPFSSLPNPDNSTDETDSSLIDYQQARNTSSLMLVIRKLACVVHLALLLRWTFGHWTSQIEQMLY